MMNDENTQTLNLTKFLSTSGVASRRKSVELIRDGLVKVNGVCASNPGMRISDEDVVEYAGRRIERICVHRYIMLHKPRGYVCTNDDPHAKKKALDLVDQQDRRLFSAGRLDKDSEGLIIFSDDGDFVERLTHPSHGTQKKYDVSVEKDFTLQDIKAFMDGIRSDEEILKALSVEKIGDKKYSFVLGEGRNREIRRMIESRRNVVKRLKRVAVGGLELGNLPCGKYRDLSEDEKELVFLSF